MEKRIKEKLKLKSEFLYKRLTEKEDTAYTGYVLNVEGISIRSVSSEKAEDIAAAVEKKFGEAGLQALEKMRNKVLFGEQ